MPRNNSTSRDKRLVEENYKTLMKEIKKMKPTKGKIFHVWIRRINILKITVLPKTIYRFNSIPIKLPMAFFTELQEKISQLLWKHKSSQIAKAILRKKIRAGRSNLSDFRLYYKATVIKTV